MSLADALLRPRSIAIVGASDDRTKTTARPLAFLRASGFDGAIFPINPRRETVMGERAWPSIAALPAVPDHVFVATPTDTVAAAVAACVEKGVPLVTILAGGYGEEGAEGRAREDQLRALLAGSATRMIGPNSIGVAGVHAPFVLTANAAFAEADIPRGGLFVASHSGSMIGALLSRGKSRGVGFAGFVSTGGEVDLSLGEICAATLEDDRIDCYALFLESIRNGDALRRFAEAAAAAGRPVVAYKLGRSAQAAELAQSHTGAIAGEDGIADAFLKSCGIARVDTIEGLLEAPALMRHMTVGGGGRTARIGVVTTTGGAAAMVVDQLGIRNMDVVTPSSETMVALAAAGVAASPGRIVDLTLAGTQPAVMKAAIATLLAAPEFDMVVGVAGSSARFQPELLVPAMVEGAATSAKPFVAFVAPEAPEALAQLTAGGVPCFRTPETCADVIAAAFARRAPRPSGPASAGRGVERALDEAEGYAALARLGIGAAEHAVISPDATTSPLPYPVAIKLLSAEVVHKTDIGGVRLGIDGDAAFGAAVADIVTDVPLAAPHVAVERLLVQSMTTKRAEVLLSFTRDPDAGAFVMLAGGGLLAEIYRDRSLRIAPVNREGALEMIGEVRLLEAVSGYRGQAKGDLDALADAIVAISHAGPEFSQIEINPLLIGAEGDGVVAVDAVVRMREG